MPTRSQLVFATALLFAACASAPKAPAVPAGPEIEIPRFAAGDPRVDQPGFVGQTLRLKHVVGDTTYTLMTFVVGDTLTLGAMVKGPFRGNVHWTIGARELRLPFDTKKAEKNTPVAVTGSRAVITAQGAWFQSNAWTNVELPCAEWLPAGTPLQLEFVPASGTAVTLPEAGAPYQAKFVAR